MARRALKPALDRLYREFDRVDSASDPVHIVRRYPRRDDREIVGFCAASLAFGRVSGLMNSIERLLDCMGPDPATFVRTFDPARNGAGLERLVHRWTRGRDFVALVWILRQMLERSTSIEEFFLGGLDTSDRDVGPAIESFSRRARAIDLRPAYGRPRGTQARPPSRPHGVYFFFPRPSTGSACKRLNLFLRWMVRRDAVDLGVWSRVPASKLVVPLDTHITRVGRCLQLTRYKSPGWKMAAEITASLRRLDPQDPVRYDFALCHVGMHGRCGLGRARGDRTCPLRGLCKPGG